MNYTHTYICASHTRYYAIWPKVYRHPWSFNDGKSKCVVAQSSSIKKSFFQFGLEKLDWPAQSPELNPIQHLWDQLEHVSIWVQCLGVHIFLSTVHFRSEMEDINLHIQYLCGFCVFIQQATYALLNFIQKISDFFSAIFEKYLLACLYL